MDPRVRLHNTHWDSISDFLKNDPHLRALKNQPYHYESPLLEALPTRTPGIYTIGGGRQIGKTTLLKQWMGHLLAKKVPPQAIMFFSGELIDDHHALLQLMQTQLAAMPDRLCYFLLDEVTYIKDWDKAVKYAADAGLLEKVVLMLTGSDLVLMQEARMRFPGRRGTASHVNFHLYPLSFRETVLLKHPKHPDEKSSAFLELLFKEWDQYLLHGGYLTAINDIAKHRKILPATLMIYSDWIRGDMLKRGKQELYLREILGAIVKRYGSQITWNALAQDLSIDHPSTVADYISLLESMDAVFVQSAILEDKLVAAPKKAKKVMFADPFIFHAVRFFLSGQQDSGSDPNALLKDPVWCGKLTEAAVVTHFRRRYPTYYIKAEGEVDIAYVDKSRFWPVEVKWTQQLHVKDLKQILKYPNARILTKSKLSESIHEVAAEPLPLALWKFKDAEFSYSD